MIPSTTRSEHDRAVRYPREIAAAVTLRAACAALTDGPAERPLSPVAAIAVLTSCAALATRFAILDHLADPDEPDPRTAVPFDAFADSLPTALTGAGPMPVRGRLRTAGDRAADAWHVWRAGNDPHGCARGAAGALSIAAWCAWGLGSAERARTRAVYALETAADDPLASLVLRMVRCGVSPAWDRW
ncbi:MAG: hypothetical protein V4737_12990 [Curtobacterium sp.]